MDPIEILGSLLGQKAGGSGTGADILKDIFNGLTRGESPAQSEPAPASRAPTSRAPATNDIDQQARELEDMLNVARNRSTGQPTPQARPQQPPAAPRQPAEAPARPGSRLDAPQDDDVARQNEQATVLVRAMVNAAKCDGQISQAEQQAIINQLDNPSPAAIQFLRDEFAKPLDVREFAWSVPVGMEQQVYTMSLIAIDVDSDREERYLRELSRGLRLAPEVCEQIKERLTGAGSRFAGAR
jgi:Protein of unknown function (DUF533)